jgi:hypothetical protein
MASLTQIARTLQHTDPRMFARLERDIAVSKQADANMRLELLKQKLEAAQAELDAARHAADIAVKTFANDWGDSVSAGWDHAKALDELTPVTPGHVVELLDVFHKRHAGSGIVSRLANKSTNYGTS